MSSNINNNHSQYASDPELYNHLRNIYIVVARPRVFELIPEAIRNQIYGQVFELARPATNDWWWGGRNAFQDLSRLQAAVQQVAFNLFRVLPSEQRNAVAGIIYEYSGRPETSDLQWGENHANDNPGLLLMSLAIGEEISNHSPFFNLTYQRLFSFYNDIGMLRTLELLPQAIRNQIYGQVYEFAGRPQTRDAEWGRHNAFQDWDRLQLAFQQVAINIFRALPDGTRNAVALRIYRNLGSPATSDPQWGENHANYNTEVLLQSLREGIESAAGYRFHGIRVYDNSFVDYGLDSSDDDEALPLFTAFTDWASLQFGGFMQPLEEQLPSTDVGSESFEQFLSRLRNEASSSSHATTSVSIPVRTEAAATLEQMVQRKTEGLARLRQLEAMETDINHYFGVNEDLLTFDMDVILQRYPADENPSRLYNFVGWAGVDNAKRGNFYRAVRQFDGLVTGQQDIVVKDLLSRLHSYFIQKAVNVVDGSAEENQLKAQYRLYVDKIIDANRNCIDQMLSQVQEIMLDIAGDAVIDGSHGNAFASLQARAGHVLCTYRTNLLKSICLRQNPNEPHLADLERMVVQRLAPVLGIEGAIFNVGAQFRNLIDNVDNKVDRVLAAFREEYRPLQYLTAQIRTDGIDPMQKLRVTLNDWAMDHYAIAAENPANPQPATDMNPRLSANFDPDAFTDFANGGEWTPAGAFLILEATGLVQEYVNFF